MCVPGTFRRWECSCRFLCDVFGRHTRQSTQRCGTPAPSASSTSRTHQSGTAAGRPSRSNAPDRSRAREISVQGYISHLTQQTSCSKNLSSKVFSPGLFPAPSNKALYSWGQTHFNLLDEFNALRDFNLAMWLMKKVLKIKNQTNNVLQYIEYNYFSCCQLGANCNFQDLMWNWEKYTALLFGTTSAKYSSGHFLTLNFWWGIGRIHLRYFQANLQHSTLPQLWPVHSHPPLQEQPAHPDRVCQP